jgi:hypothetical protein
MKTRNCPVTLIFDVKKRRDAPNEQYADSGLRVASSFEIECIMSLAGKK